MGATTEKRNKQMVGMFMLVLIVLCRTHVAQAAPPQTADNRNSLFAVLAVTHVLSVRISNLRFKVKRSNNLSNAAEEILKFINEESISEYSEILRKGQFLPADVHAFRECLMVHKTDMLKDFKQVLVMSRTQLTRDFAFNKLAESLTKLMDSCIKKYLLPDKD